MSEANAQEPTMEEILASIRRIISEDETPAASAEAETSPPEPAAAAAPPPAAAAPTPAVEAPPPPPPEPVKAKAPKAAAPPSPPPSADVLELTQRVEPAPKPAPVLPPSGDIDFSDAPAPVAAAPAAMPGPRPPMGGSLVSDSAATTAAGHFGQLAQSVAQPAGRTLEDMVTEMLRPMLKDWLEANLPKIVEASVAAEIERISRRGY